MEDKEEKAEGPRRTGQSIFQEKDRKSDSRILSENQNMKQSISFLSQAIPTVVRSL